MKKFQKAKGLESDGEAGPKTLTTLTTKISSGARGGSVTALSTLLSAVGYRTGSRPVSVLTPSRRSRRSKRPSDVR